LEWESGNRIASFYELGNVNNSSFWESERKTFVLGNKIEISFVGIWSENETWNDSCVSVVVGNSNPSSERKEGNSNDGAEGIDCDCKTFFSRETKKVTFSAAVLTVFVPYPEGRGRDFDS